MQISVTEAKAKLPELVRRAEAGEEIILTKHGRVAAQILPAIRQSSPAERRQLIARVRALAAKKVTSGGPSAERSQDFLYDDLGLPK